MDLRHRTIATFYTLTFCPFLGPAVDLRHRYTAIFCFGHLCFPLHRNPEEELLQASVFLHRKSPLLERNYGPRYYGPVEYGRNHQ